MANHNKKVIVAYGFEYDALINDNSNCILCKCFETQHPFYAAPTYIESTNIKTITEQIQEIERTQKGELQKIDQLAKRRFLSDGNQCEPCWRTVIYYENIKFNHLDIGYESEGDENGDGR